MNVRVMDDSVEVTGYVNAVERNSKPLKSRIGAFIEKICAGAFERAISRNDDIHLLLNHNWGRDLGSTKSGNLELREDAIGLKAKATITDSEVVEKARRGDLVGWSFGFTDRDVDASTVDGVVHRAVKDLDLYEVSLLDRQKSPAYSGTLVEARADEIEFRGEPMLDEVTVEEPVETRAEEAQEIDYSIYENMINEMKEG